jgi:hypothetical protein
MPNQVRTDWGQVVPVEPVRQARPLQRRARLLVHAVQVGHHAAQLGEHRLVEPQHLDHRHRIAARRVGRADHPPPLGPVAVDELHHPVRGEQLHLVGGTELSEQLLEARPHARSADHRPQLVGEPPAAHGHRLAAGDGVALDEQDPTPPGGQQRRTRRAAHTRAHHDDVVLVHAVPRFSHPSIRLR